MGVRLVFFFHPVNTHLEAILMSIYLLSMALNAALRAAAQRIGGKSFSRKSALTAETVIRLLIGAEGGSLAKILHDAAFKLPRRRSVSAALKSRPKCSAQFSPTSIPLAPTMSSFVVIVCWQWTEQRSICRVTPKRPHSFRTTASPKA